MSRTLEIRFLKKKRDRSESNLLRPRIQREAGVHLAFNFIDKTTTI